MPLEDKSKSLLRFLSIPKLLPTEYVEEICSVIEPKFFDGIKGTHTYNFDSHLIVIDYVEISKKTSGL